MKKNIAVIILAAGKSTRMNSQRPKVLHPLCSRPMLGYVLDLAEGLRANRIITVLGHKHQEVRKILKPKIKVVRQRRLLGTADGVKAALPLLGNFKGTVLILCADTPLLKKKTITDLLESHAENQHDATLLTAQLNNPQGYGRILRDKYASICGIVEENDADDFQKEIKEINTGIICFKKESLIRALKYIKPHNRKKEYYLTDAIGILYKNGSLVDNVKVSDTQEILGINSRAELAQANKVMQRRIHEALMKAGVAIIDPDSTFISYNAKIGRDTVIYPFTVIEKDVRIGKFCSIGPFAHVREVSRIEDGVHIGNFVEIARSRVKRNTSIRHFGYIGDSRIGKMANIGAGTITANFDGKKKNATVIKDKAFIGSDTVLIAPVTIGRNAVTGAGSVVTRNTNVPEGATVVGVPARVLKRRGKL